MYFIVLILDIWNTEVLTGAIFFVIFIQKTNFLGFFVSPCRVLPVLRIYIVSVFGIYLALVAAERQTFCRRLLISILHITLSLPVYAFRLFVLVSGIC